MTSIAGPIISVLLDGADKIILTVRGDSSPSTVIEIDVAANAELSFEVTDVQ